VKQCYHTKQSNSYRERLIEKYQIKSTTKGKAEKRTSPLTEFTIFPKLPPEIRDQIWDWAAEGRIIEVRFDKKTQRYFHQTPAPITMSVNQESRKMAQLRFKKLEIHFPALDVVGRAIFAE
jgi:hypothetical protein